MKKKSRNIDAGLMVLITTGTILSILVIGIIIQLTISLIPIL